MLDEITSRVQTITLAFDDPRLKPAVCRALVEKLTSRTNIDYIDFDLQFSSLLQNLDPIQYDRISNGGKLVVFQPSDDILDFVESLAAQNMQTGGVIFLDSLNTLQNLLTDDMSSRGSRIANQKTALLVTFLHTIGRFYSKSLVIINITKSRPSDKIELSSSIWEKTLVGGRMIRFKSDSILTVNLKQGTVPAVELKLQQSHERKATNESTEQRFLIDV